MLGIARTPVLPVNSKLHYYVMKADGMEKGPSYKAQLADQRTDPGLSLLRKPDTPTVHTTLQAPQPSATNPKNIAQPQLPAHSATAIANSNISAFELITPTALANAAQGLNAMPATKKILRRNRVKPLDPEFDAIVWITIPQIADVVAA